MRLTTKKRAAEQDICGATGKKMLKTKAEAIGMAGQMRAAKGNGARTMNAYRCGWCQHWHTGNKGGSTSKGRARKGR
jgi:hypothetical protein